MFFYFSARNWYICSLYISLTLYCFYLSKWTGFLFDSDRKTLRFKVFSCGTHYLFHSQSILQYIYKHIFLPFQFQCIKHKVLLMHKAFLTPSDIYILYTWRIKSRFTKCNTINQMRIQVVHETIRFRHRFQFMTNCIAYTARLQKMYKARVSRFAMIVSSFYVAMKLPQALQSLLLWKLKRMYSGKLLRNISIEKKKYNWVSGLFLFSICLTLLKQ